MAPADEITPEEPARVATATDLGQVQGTLAALCRIVRRRGSIVQTFPASASAPLQAACCGAKLAVSSLADRQAAGFAAGFKGAQLGAPSADRANLHEPASGPRRSTGASRIA